MTHIELLCLCKEALSDTGGHTGLVQAIDEYMADYAPGATVPVGMAYEIEELGKNVKTIKQFVFEMEAKLCMK